MMVALPQCKMLDEANNIEALKTLIQKDQDSSLKLAQEVKYHEDNLKYLKSDANIIDESIHLLQGELKECQSLSMSVEADSTINFENLEKHTEQMRQLDKTAGGLICKLKDRHGSMLSQLKCTKDVLGIVASLGKAGDDNLSWILSEYLGKETMLAIVCKTLDGIQALENYEKDGTIDKNAGLHAIAPTIGRNIDGRFLVYCLQNLRPFSGEFIPGDSQKKLALKNPRMPNGKLPPGFLGFAVNMIYMDEQYLSSVTVDGRGLREILFFTLFSHLQVYTDRKDMIDAIPFISDGAVSLDGGIIKNNYLFYLGDRCNFDIRFPITVARPLKDASEIEQKIKIVEWKKQMISSDIKREETLINNAKSILKAKTDGFKKLINDEQLNKELMMYISKTNSPRS